jgi:hypothetical protein
MSTSFKPNNKKKLNTDFAIAKKLTRVIEVCMEVT